MGRIAAPLTALMKKRESKQFDNFSTEETHALAKLQQNLLAAQLLALPCSEDNLTLGTEAYDTKIGCTLMQDDIDGAKEPLRYLA